LLLMNAANAFAQFELKELQVLQQLKGSWESVRKKGILTEVWKVENDSTMLGYSYMKTNSDSIPQETVELVLRNGKIYYIPTTANQNNQQPISFALVKIENRKYFFENKAHDFPQQISYELIDDKTLQASISGQMNDSLVNVLFDFKRIN